LSAVLMRARLQDRPTAQASSRGWLQAATARRHLDRDRRDRLCDPGRSRHSTRTCQNNHQPASARQRAGPDLMTTSPSIQVAYDGEWPALLRQRSSALREALGDVALRIDHIGSTAVPRLAAKPIIDIQISVAAFEPLDAFRAGSFPPGHTSRSHPRSPMAAACCLDPPTDRVNLFYTLETGSANATTPRSLHGLRARIATRLVALSASAWLKHSLDRPPEPSQPSPTNTTRINS
jgi:GrpB-like predicted nucleotidyltransferase (UPF0157 family)